MKYFFSIFLFIGLLATPGAFVFAHETREYTIGGLQYRITVGSLGEPVVVDDKTGLDLTIAQNGEPLVGVEEDLKVEVFSGEVSKVFDLEGVYGSDGKYKTTFFLTKDDPLKYRLFGTLNGVAVDFVYECAAAGHVMHATADTTVHALTDEITQTLKRGAFGCPVAKSAYEFPIATNDQATVVAESTAAQNKAALALALAAAALVLSGIALVRQKRS